MVVINAEVDATVQESGLEPEVYVGCLFPFQVGIGCRFGGDNGFVFPENRGFINGAYEVGRSRFVNISLQTIGGTQAQIAYPGERLHPFLF